LIFNAVIKYQNYSKCAPYILTFHALYVTNLFKIFVQYWPDDGCNGRNL